MPEEELRVTIRLKDFATRGVKKFQAVTTAAAKKVGAAFGRVKSAVFSLKGAIAGFALGAFAKSTIDAFTAQEKSIAGMEQAMKSMKRFTPELSKSLQDLASNIQAVGVSGDEATLEGIKFLVTYRKIGNDILPRATKAMADLAALTGRDMASAANILGKASEGMVGELSRYGITISDAAKKSKDFNLILADIESQVAGQQEALRKTGYGGIQAFNNALGDLKEKVGEAIVQTLLPAINNLQARFSTLGPAVKNATKTGLEFTIKAIARVVDGYKVAKMAVISFVSATLKARVTLEKINEERAGTLGEWWIQLKALAGNATDADKEAWEKILQQRDKAHELTDAERALVEIEKLRVNNIRESFSTYDDAVKWLEAMNRAAAGGTGGKSDGGASRPTDYPLVDDIGKAKYETRMEQMKREAAAEEKYQAGRLQNLFTYHRTWTDEHKKTAQETAERYDKLSEHITAWTNAEIAQNNRRMEAWKDTVEAAKQYAYILSEHILVAIESAVEGTFEWQAALKALAADVARMAFRQAASIAISYAGKAMMGAADGGVFPAFEKRIPIRGLAEGGITQGPEIALIGEGRDQEAVLPLKRGQDGKLGVAQQGGGGGDTYQINITAMDSKDVERVFMDNPDELMRAIAQGKQNNPSLFE